MNNLFSVQAQPELTRREFFNGEEHLVVPLVALVEGVIHSANADSPQLALAEEFGKFPQGWDGRPVVVNHPKMNGQPVSANLPEVLESEKIGQLFNTRLEGKKLKTEAWINISLAEDKGEEVEGVLRGLEAEEITEVSTGLFADTEAGSGKHNGKTFEGTWRNVVPDHLAILSDSLGACSVADGCGAPRINEEFCCPACARGAPCINEGVTANVCKTARTPKFNGTEEEPWTGLTLLDFGVESFGKLTDAEKATVASLTLLGDSKADNSRDLVFFPVVNQETGKLNKAALEQVSAPHALAHGPKVPARTLASAQAKAKQLLSRHFDETSDEFGPCKKIMDKTFALWNFEGKSRSDNDVRAALDAAITVTQDNFAYVIAVFSDSFIWATWDGLFQQGFEIADDGAVSLGEEVTPVRPETEFVPVTVNKENDMTKEERVKGLISNEGTNFTEKDETWLLALEDEQLEKMEPAEAPEPTEEELAAALVAAAETAAVEAVARGAETPVTASEYIGKAPPEVQEVLNSGLRMHEARRADITKGIIANAKNSFTAEELAKMPMDSLEKLAALSDVDDFTGRGLPRTLAAAAESDQPPPMPLVFEAKQANSA